MSKLLYIGSKIANPKDGADQVNKRNQLLLESIFPAAVTYLTPSEIRSYNPLCKLFLGVSNTFIKEVIDELDSDCYRYLFICHSTMGRLAEKVRQSRPKIKIITFYHNIEIQYAKEYFRTTGLRALPFYLAVKYWEKKACDFSDYHITLNRRDSNLLKCIYNKDAALELPTSFVDRFSEVARNKLIENNIEKIDYLFVGVAFFANIHGIQWFIDNVMPRVDGHLHIIGKGMDKVEFRNLNDRIHIHGFVEDLSYYYYNANCVVSPIFVGGGMKTKTAEALMFGKTIVGTNEAFEGYVLEPGCMKVCNTADEFVASLSGKNNVLNMFARRLFSTYYSAEASLTLLSRFFKKHE